MPFCSQCGDQVHEEAKFCSGCGSPVSSASTPADSQPGEDVAVGRQRAEEEMTEVQQDAQSATAAVATPDSLLGKSKGLASQGLAKMAEVKASRDEKAREARIDCPHCGGLKTVTVKQVKKKKGFSPGKVAGAFATAGISMLATGLAKKGEVNQLTCSKCTMKWYLE